MLPHSTNNKVRAVFQQEKEKRSLSLHSAGKTHSNPATTEQHSGRKRKSLRGALRSLHSIRGKKRCILQPKKTKTNVTTFRAFSVRFPPSSERKGRKCVLKFACRLRLRCCGAKEKPPAVARGSFGLVVVKSTAQFRFLGRSFRKPIAQWWRGKKPRPRLVGKSRHRRSC